MSESEGDDLDNIGGGDSSASDDGGDVGNDYNGPVPEQQQQEPSPRKEYPTNSSSMAPAASNGDVRKDYILTTIANHFSLSSTDAIVAGLVTDSKLNNFLDDGNSMLLSANLQKLPDQGGTQIYLDNTVHVDSKDNKVR